ncbi:MAG: hypothetical protein I8H75_04650 [Myxococcaceae bacterium]|nr:hypothetical protein [Myxococcaceae bacterium]MBH2006613.1 hypothetical protein [Myxococcaceae bacterium]
MADSHLTTNSAMAAAVALVGSYGNGAFGFIIENSTFTSIDSNVSALGANGRGSPCAAIAVVTHMSYYNPGSTWITGTNLRFEVTNSNVTAMGGAATETPTGSIAILCSSWAFDFVSIQINNCSIILDRSLAFAMTGSSSDSPAAAFAMGAYESAFGPAATATVASILLSASNSSVWANSSASPCWSATVASSNGVASLNAIHLELYRTQIRSIGPNEISFAALGSANHPFVQNNVSLYLIESNITSWGCLFAIPQGNLPSVMYEINCSCNQTGWAPGLAQGLTGDNLIINGTLWNSTLPGLPFPGIVWRGLL